MQFLCALNSGSGKLFIMGYNFTSSVRAMLPLWYSARHAYGTWVMLCNELASTTRLEFNLRNRSPSGPSSAPVGLLWFTFTILLRDRSASVVRIRWPVIIKIVLFFCYYMYFLTIYIHLVKTHIQFMFRIFVLSIVCQTCCRCNECFYCVESTNVVRPVRCYTTEISAVEVHRVTVCLSTPPAELSVAVFFRIKCN